MLFEGRHKQTEILGVNETECMSNWACGHKGVLLSSPGTRVGKNDLFFAGRDGVTQLNKNCFDYTALSKQVCTHRGR